MQASGHNCHLGRDLSLEGRALWHLSSHSQQGLLMLRAQGSSVAHFHDLFAAESLVRNARPEPRALLHVPPEASEE